MHLDKEEADRFFNIAFSAALLAGRDAVLNQSWEGLKVSKLWQDDGADPQKTPQELQERTSIHFDWAKQQCLNEIMLNVTDPRITSVHERVCEMVALLLALAQEPSQNSDWTATTNYGCVALGDLLTLTERAFKHPEVPIPDNTCDRLIRAGDNVNFLNLEVNSLLKSLRENDREATIRYQKRIFEISDAVGLLREHFDND